MGTAGETGSIDALLEREPGSLTDGELKDTLRALGRARARLDGVEAAMVAEFDQRAC